MLKTPNAQVTKETDELGLKVKNLGINQRSEKRDEMATHTCNPSTPGADVGRRRV